MRINYCFIFLTLIIFIMSSLSAQEKAHKYVGAKKCRTCHKKAEDGEQFKIWSEGPHANAFKTLSSEKALKFAKENGIADPAKEAKCLKCHSTYASIDESLIDLKGKLTLEEGVSCESCHGPGSAYKKKKIMKDHELSVKNGLIIPDEKTCVTCHTKEGNSFFKPFDFKKRVKKITHSIPEKK